MADALSARQIQILKLLIDEYIETAEPVGSEALDKKYNLGISPATIRNEMAALIRTGFLKQIHTSSGRVPTPKAMKLYVDQLMEEKQMSLAEEVKAKEDVGQGKGDIDRIMDDATHALARQTGSLAVAAVDTYNKIWHAGYANVFQNPEFADMMLCESLFSMIDEVERINDLMFHRVNPSSILDVMFGEELSWPNLSPVSIVTTHFNIYGKKGALGIVGPARLSYPRVVPVLKYFGSLIEEATR
jgi:transcriptional regulator of heat shock response